MAISIPRIWKTEVSKYGPRDAAANGEDACAKVLTGLGFARGAACPCSLYSKERVIRVVVHGDDFLSGGARSQLEWLEKVMDKHYEAKHTMMGESRGRKKSIVMLKQTNSMEKFGGSCTSRTRHTAKLLSRHRICNKRKKWASLPVKDNEREVQGGECSWDITSVEIGE